MLTLRTFGGLSLESDAGALGGAAVQRRRMAILALLAIARDRGLSRDKLLAYLWPEDDTDRARHTLSQLLYALRRDLDADVIVATGDMLRLNREVIWSDVAEFEDALDAGESEHALALYAGPFLDGWYVGDAPGFERWTEDQRSRLNQRAIAALRQLAQGAMARADHESAVTWWRQLVTIDPVDARAAVGLMTALAAAGDRAGALRHAHVYEEIVKQEIDVPADRAVTRLVEQLRSGTDEPPSISAAMMSLPTSGSAAASGAAPSNAPNEIAVIRPSRRRPHRGRRAAILGAIGLLVLVAYMTSIRLATSSDPDAGRDPAVSPRSVAVLPFVNMSSDAENEYFSDGMTEELINTLARTEGLHVPARTSAFAFKGKRVPVTEIGRQLRVATVLEGSVRRAGSRLRVTAQLVDAGNGYHLWSEVYDRELTDVFRVQEEIARAIATRLRGDLLGGARAQRSNRPTENVNAYDLYLRGRYFWNQRSNASLNKSIEYYGRALALDSGYALAHAGLADSYAILGANGFRPLDEVFPKARSAAATALALDSTLSEVHATLALIEWLTWRWGLAELEFRRSIALDSMYATVRMWYALYLSGMGRSTEAIREITRARQLDPLSLIVNAELGRVLELARRDDQAANVYRQTLEMDSTFGPANYLLAMLYSRTRQFDSSGRILARMLRASPASDLAEVRGYAYAMQADSAAAHRVLAELKSLRASRYVSPHNVAAIYAALGDRAQGIEWLQKAYTERASEMYALKVDPLLDPLRSDPRFVELLHRMRLD
jgi:serine/threonine-protein kinase